MMLLWPEQPVMWCLSAARSVLLNLKKNHIMLLEHNKIGSYVDLI